MTCCGRYGCVFTQRKLRHHPNELVIFRDGQFLTLAEVFKSLSITAYERRTLLWLRRNRSHPKRVGVIHVGVVCTGTTCPLTRWTCTRTRGRSTASTAST